MKKVLAILISLFTYLVFGQQIWIDTTDEGLYYQNAVFAKVVIDAIGKDTILVWLNSKCSFSATCVADSSGYFTNILRIKSNNLELSNEQVIAIETEWKRQNYRIPYCVSECPDTKEGRDRIRRSIRERVSLTGNDTMNVTVLLFPPLNVRVAMFHCHSYSMNSIQSFIDAHINYSQPIDN